MTNPSLARQILAYCEQHPSTSVDSIRDAFSSVDGPRVHELIVWLIESGYLRAPIRRKSLMDGVVQTVGQISGLTNAGRGYLHG